jgi:uroporphyrin-III C-methyltransferase/precorrin-2 dehydrogenase/sirohydrochlorin ferrochelatase
MTGGYRLELDLRDRDVLVAGGGPAAARHARRCLDAGARVLVLAEHACEDVTDLVAAGLARWRPRELRAADLDGAWLVHAATGSPEGDDRVAALAGTARVWCVSDSPAAPARVPSRGRRPAGDGRGRVALVGGGPGEPSLITVLGRRLLREADVVVVDRLAPVGLLDELDPDVEVIDVGKSPDHHPVPQEEINRLLVEHARAGRRVVRLKGGDPYVLGRGHEELLACRAGGVEVSVVPGVTSAFAVPAAAGIPVTHRGLSRSVTVLTGHDDPNYAALADLGGTIVVLMGVARLPLLTAGLLDAGMPAATPLTIVERGWTAAQRTVLSSLGAAAEDARRHGVSSPAVVVIGDVAALAGAG